MQVLCLRSLLSPVREGFCWRHYSLRTKQPFRRKMTFAPCSALAQSALLWRCKAPVSPPWRLHGQTSIFMDKNSLQRTQDSRKQLSILIILSLVAKLPLHRVIGHKHTEPRKRGAMGKEARHGFLEVPPVQRHLEQQPGAQIQGPRAGRAARAQKGPDHQG